MTEEAHKAIYCVGIVIVGAWLKVMLEQGVSALTPEQRKDWARFLVAFGARTPETLREHGPEFYRQAMEQAQANPTDDAVAEAVVAGMIGAEMPRLEINVPLNIAMEFAQDDTKVRRVTSMEWWIRRFDKPVLISDRPLLSDPSANWPCGIAIDSDHCLIFLPIAPDRVFFASGTSKTRSKMSKAQPGTLLSRINQELVRRAVEFVYAANDDTDSFIARVLSGHTSIWPLNKEKMAAQKALLRPGQ